MSQYELRKLEGIEEGKIQLYKLAKDGNCEFDDFLKKIKEDGNLVKQLVAIQTRLQDIANMKRLPKEKFRDITPKKTEVKEYEIKTKNLRVYLFKEEGTGKVIVCAGKKSTQSKDIRRFRKIKKAYLDSKQ